MKTLLYLSLFACLFACTKPKQEVVPEALICLQVDFESYEFEGAYQYPYPIGDSLNFLIDYQEPGDFGSMDIYLDSLSQPVFSGTIIWMGTGERSVPKRMALTSEDNFLVPARSEMEYSDSFRVQFIQGNQQSQFKQIPMDSIWNTIAQFQNVQDNILNGKQLYLYVYQASVGDGNPADWDFYVFFRN